MPDPAVRLKGGPLAVLLLPARLDEVAFAEHARDLLRAPRIVALEPPRVSWTRLASLPPKLARRAGMRQAKRLKLRGEIRVVILYGPLQALLATALLERNRAAELWYLRAGAESERAGAGSERAGAESDRGEAQPGRGGAGPEHRGGEPDPDAEANPVLVQRIHELDELARSRATLSLELGDLAPGPEQTWFDANEPLWDRLEELEIAQFT